MIRIFQRHCNFSSNSSHKGRPKWFNREKIFNTLMSTIDNRVEYTAVFDNGSGDITEHFLSNKKTNIIEIEAGSEAKSFLSVLNHVKNQNYNDEDIIYFVEDDYIHRKGWVDILLEGVEMIGADYYTLYDHPDKYYLPMYENLQSKIIATNSVHWRTTPSTTCTFACKFGTFKKYYDIHTKFCNAEQNYTKDHDMFLCLWEMGSNLVSCIPGYSAHVENHMLSPLINWEKI